MTYKSFTLLNSALSEIVSASDLSYIEIRKIISSVIFNQAITLAPPDLPLFFDEIAIRTLKQLLPKDSPRAGFAFNKTMVAAGRFL